MSRSGRWGSRILDLDLFESIKDPHLCAQCGGAGVVFESIDDERLPVAVPCHGCKSWCNTCKAWVKRKDHSHELPHV